MTTENKKYEAVIGLEVHAQLKTKSKIFCGCSTTFEEKENVNTCPVCTGMPGSLPVLNKRAVDFAIKAALATHCNVNAQSIFARKNYFYPDLPKGYQISQYDKPLAEGGYVEITFGKKDDLKHSKIGLTRIHMEEDAGKNVHLINQSLVNLNRAGIPLIEIVSEPDIRSSEEAGNYLRELQKILRYLDISEANMEEGNLRCDVNISLRSVGQKAFGTRAEIKNMNSFRFIEKAIEYEIERQTDILERGKKVVQETRLWNSNSSQTFSMRSKEEAHDYRYFPDPDLLPLMVDEAWCKDIQKHLPELPSDRKNRLMKDFGLSEYDASILTQEKVLVEYFEEAAAVSKSPKLVSNWISSELLREYGMEEVATCPISAKNLGILVQLIENKTISGKIAKTVFEKMAKSGDNPKEIVEREGLVQITDTVTIEKIVDDVLKQNQDAVDKYLGGNQKLFGFLVGQTMKATKGKASPGIVNELLKKKLKNR